jgi:hypothetical protein
LSWIENGENMAMFDGFKSYCLPHSDAVVSELERYGIIKQVPPSWKPIVVTKMFNAEELGLIWVV